MKTLLLLVPIVLSVFLSAGCTNAPPPVQIAQQKQQDALANLRQNMDGFVLAALKDLELALHKQVDDELLRREAGLTNPDGTISLAKYKAELAMANQKKEESTSQVQEQFNKYTRLKRDLEDAIEVGNLLTEYLNRDAVTAQDAAALIEKITAILGG